MKKNQRNWNVKTTKCSTSLTEKEEQKMARLKEDIDLLYINMIKGAFIRSRLQTNNYCYRNTLKNLILHHLWSLMTYNRQIVKEKPKMMQERLRYPDFKVQDTGDQQFI